MLQVLIKLGWVLATGHDNYLTLTKTDLVLVG